MYKNYHKHDHYGNPWAMDVVVKPEEYCKRAVELGHDSVFTVNHGVTGNIFEWIELSKKYGLKMHYGMEAYYVKDRFEKDRSNKHLIIIAKNNDGVMQLNDIMTEAHSTGFYYKPRIDYNLLLSLDPNNFIITSACVAGIWNEPELILALHRKFGKNFFLEVQAHSIKKQIEVNTEVLRLSKETGIPIIHANDSHYIYPEDSKYRDILQKAKNIYYDFEENMVLDYPDEDEIYNRYEKQGVLSKEQVRLALDNTMVFDECEPITLINDEIKLPPISQHPMDDLRSIIREQWKIERQNIPKDMWKKYTDAIVYELDIVEKTNMANYFLIDYKVAKDGQTKYGGRLTNTGRGSAPSFYITKLLGLTDIDRISAPITLFPTRFMSVERILGTRSLPDIDLNTTDRTPFIKATEDLLGAENCAWMLAWKPLQDASAFRTYCKGIGKNISEYDDIAKNLELYENDNKWKNIIKESKRFVGVIESISESPCFTANYLVNTSDGYKRICDVKNGDYVLTHNNRYEQVIINRQKQCNELFELKIMGCEPIEVTGNHPFFIRKHIGRKYTKDSNPNKYTSIRKFTDPYWERVENLQKGDFIAQPVNEKSLIPIGDLDFESIDFWWIVGRYIGDGWLRIQSKGINHGQSYHTLICCNNKNKEDKEIENKLNGLFSYSKSKDKSTYRYDISSKSLYLFLQQFGKYAFGKHLTNTIIDLPIDKLQNFLKGYFSADGYILKNRTIQSVTSVSRELIYGIQQCVHKAYKLPTTIVKQNKDNIKPSTLGDGRKIIAKHDVYILSFSISNHHQDGFYENGYMWLPYRKKSIKNGDYTVYNLQVKNDESYTINNIAVHNCSMLLYDKPVRQELGLVRTSKDKLCCLLDGYNCDKYKYLKNDYLTVTVWAIIRDVCKLVKIPIPTIKEIDDLFDNKTFDIYRKGLTSTINQADSDYATGLVTKYCPKNISEMSAFVAIIRPGCLSLLKDFIERKSYTTGVPELDEILVEGKHRMIYQELIMKYLIWLGIPETSSYDIIKKIAKKKFKEEELAELKNKLRNGWKKRVGKEEGFIETWTVVEQAAKYSFNACVSGDTLIQKAGITKSKHNPTVEEMYKIMNNIEYAKENNHLSLHRKYRSCGYGNALSMFEDGRIRTNRIIDIRQSGIRNIYRITTENGSFLDCTDNHKFPTPQGKKKLSELNIGDLLYVKGSKEYYKTSKKKCFDKGIPTELQKIVSIEFIKTDMTYDIEMADPAHTFISDSGLVTSNSHSLSYAYDSLYGAYLKSHYPLEYYTVALNYYDNDSERTLRLTNELKYFGIQLKPIKFRFSKSDYALVKNENNIYKGIKSIKEMNAEVADEIFELRNNKYNTFIELLEDIALKTSAKKNQIKILIELDFFEEFGDINTLLVQNDLFNKYYGKVNFKKNEILKDNISAEFMQSISSKETEKMFMGVDSVKMITKLANNTKIRSRSLSEQIQSQIEYLGYITIKDDRYSGMAVALSVDTKYAPKLKLYSLKNGTTLDCKIDKKTFNKDKLKAGNIVRIKSTKNKPKVTKNANGEWETVSGTNELWITSYCKVENL